MGDTEASSVFLYISLFFLTLTLTGLFRARKLGPLQIPYFFIGWLASELAWFHFIFQSLLSLLLIAIGATTAWQGKVALGLVAISLAGLLRMHLQGRASCNYYHTLFANAFGKSWAADIPAERKNYLRPRNHAKNWLRPFTMPRPDVERISNIPYGENARHYLDIYRSRQPSQSPCPVMLQIHGGAWILGHKAQQAQPLMHHMAQRGWLCVAINYGLSPKQQFPDHLIDVKRALVWIKNHIHQYGGDPRFIICTGGSAGGHLAMLLALTANNPAFQPGFESANTSVNGCLPIYGVYDFTNREHIRPDSRFITFLTRYVMPAAPTKNAALWELASPVAQVKEDAPPMFIVHGHHDALVFIEEARSFVEQLSKVSKQWVIYAELPGAQHAFDIFHSPRAECTIDAIQHFAEIIYSQSKLPVRLSSD